MLEFITQIISSIMETENILVGQAGIDSPGTPKTNKKNNPRQLTHGKNVRNIGIKHCQINIYTNTYLTANVEIMQ